MKKIFLCISLLSPALFFAMEEEQILTPYNSINGQPITSANVGTLLPEISQELQNKASDWLHAHHTHIVAYTEIPDPLNYESLTTQHNRKGTFPSNNPYSSNVICTLDEDHTIKMAGTLSKNSGGLKAPALL